MSENEITDEMLSEMIETISNMERSLILACLHELRDRRSVNLEALFRHMHRNNGHNRDDSCGICGLDLRHAIHSTNIDNCSQSVFDRLTHHIPRNAESEAADGQ